MFKLSNSKITMRDHDNKTTPEKRDLSLIQESVLEIKERLERLEKSQQAPKHSFDVCVVTAERNAASALSTTFQNEPSFLQQSAQASLSAEISAEEAKTGDSNQEIQYSLESLKSLLQGAYLPSSINDLYFPCSTARAPVEDIELPPMSLVVAALRKATVKLPPVILHNGFRDHMMLENLCKKVYFPARPSSKGEVTLMNGLLFYLLDAYSQEDQADLSSSDCATYAKLCEKNFCDGIQDYECLVTPTLENIQCLMMGAMKAQGDARPSLCWTLVSTGARLCQSLGYHRESEVARGPPDLADAKRHVFWMLYMIDKVMSLNLGRASSFPDYDIDVEVFSPNPNPRFWAWDKVLMSFIELCKLQGQMYDELYSARARCQPPEMRSRLIQERSASLFAWHVSLKKIDTQHAQDQNDLNLLISWSDFFYYYILTLLYGAKTSQEAATHISSQRYKAASLGLQCHVQNYAKLSSTEVPSMRVYSGWILLFSSFAPFLVVFTHSIASHSQADVDLLRQVLRTLEAGRSISAATNRLYEMCKVFLRFATAFVQSRQDCFGSYNQEEDSFTFPMEANTNNVYNMASEFSRSGSASFENMQENLVPMSAFLGTYLGENMNGLWNMDFS
ncbi:putative transcriptional regulatory protein [Lachnellula subtilissima]|uniref:Putative transcriptional regulatory protein n=1 Tax=Lachnellula subtilissima TaxID=602034 RepID=A0A8H8U319_9HELO|nr:putative transcriptional regulatory protein [Lachnellula subtilissima]